MGLIAKIFKSNYVDCSNGGLSSRSEGVCLTNVDGPFEPSDQYPAAKLVVRPRVGNLVCIPEEIGADKWTMFGGCFVYSSDSRFSEAVRHMTGYGFGFPVAMHDRVEP